MRKVILSMSVSLDGYFAGPDGEIDWSLMDDELHAHINDQFRGMSAFLLGRVDYEMMAAFWPTADSDPSVTGSMKEFAGIWRETPKLVFSRTLERTGEESAALRREVDPEEIRALKARPGGDMAVGGAMLAEAFRRHDLIDEYRILVHPVLLGRGRPLLPPLEPPAARTPLRLAGTRTFGNGVVLLHHVRADAAAPSEG
ncbi:deaminase [Streptomyces abyssalis]|uniref:Deaminase n=1 Tax=Streptomyces abyssalis TaxID=933944 RepID=A0A1E7JJM5_9ACTN|nr:dihydrofolate reductase family protein [Streptomyces abyssalis]OEU87313.1 deaminase [Streptomyces abyssalis]OEU87844.1 deaminase [Streptomyces abyssalis]OEV28423.1 deaminase [Streptomyces nanshensis]